MKLKWAVILMSLPGIVILAAVNRANPSLDDQKALIEIFVTILGVLLGFWSVTFAGEAPKRAEKGTRFRVGYVLVWCIVVSLVAYLHLETSSGIPFFELSGLAFYFGLGYFLFGYFWRSGAIEF